MAFGAHWEWRGFGGVDGTFAERNSALNKLVDRHNQKDRYLFAPGLKTNIKIRQGAESGLKFKHAAKTEGNFEQWIEREEEMFGFPIPEKGQNLLLEFLNATELKHIDSFPSGLKNGEATLLWLNAIGCQIINVHKTRVIRKWSNPLGAVMIEWTCIHKPQSFTSISLESEPIKETDSAESSASLKLLKSTYDIFQLDKMSLHPNNYLEAVATWAKSNKI